MSRIPAIVAALAVTLATFLAFASPAAAHDRRNVGPFQLVVGFLSEPAFAGMVNGVDLNITDTRANNKPVEGVEKTLTVDIIVGGLTRTLALPLRARFGLPGRYAADFQPTRAGAYTFVFKGKIDSTDVNERFESGPGRFEDVESAAPVQYPDQVPSGSDLTRRLDDLQSIADQVRILAIAAIALAAASIALSLTRAKR
jgi:hypothetical protein